MPSLIGQYEDELEKLHNPVLQEKVFEDEVCVKPTEKLITAYNRLTGAIREWYTTGDVKKAHEFGNACRTFFNCPVNVGIYTDDGTPLGYVGEDELWYDDSLYIIEKYGSKVIYSNPLVKLKYVVTGTDDGKVSCTFEEIKNGTPTGRVNYYDLDITNGAVIESKTQNLIQINDCPLRGVA